MPTPTTSSAIAFSQLTGNNVVDPLLYGTQWATSSITYSFLAPVTSYHSADYPDASLWTSIQAFATFQQQAVRNVLSSWSDVANISFTQLADNSTTVGDIRFGFSSSFDWGHDAGFGFYPSFEPSGGDIWLNPLASDAVLGRYAGTFLTSTFSPGSYAYLTLIHELGHALGLKHPFGSSQFNSAILEPDLDSRIFTVMSYSTLPDNPAAVYFTFHPTTPMVLDVLAIQALYGANYTYNAGDTTYSFDDNAASRYFETIWDGGGTNTIGYSC